MICINSIDLEAKSPAEKNENWKYSKPLILYTQNWNRELADVHEISSKSEIQQVQQLRKMEERASSS